MTEATFRVPDLPLVSRELGSPGFPLERPARLEADPAFTLTGVRARVTGGQTRGADEAWGSAIPLLGRLRVEGARTVNATLTPVGLERDLELGAAVVTERIAVPRADPVCFFEWVASGDLSLPVTWRTIDPTGAALRWRVADRGLVVELQGDRALYVFSSRPSEFTVTPVAGSGPGPGLEVHARLALAAGEAVRLVVAGITTGDDEARVLRVMDRSHVVVPVRRAEATRILDERLAVEATDEALGEALAWSKVRLDGQAPLPGPPTPLSDRTLRIALASLASGDPAPARVLATAPSPGGDDRDAARRLLAAARYLAWTGDLVTVKRAWEAVRAHAGTCLRAVAGGEDRDDGLIAGALQEMVVVAEEAGDAELVGRLRSVAGEPGDGEEVARRTTAAGPDAGADPLLHAAALIEAVVNGLLGADPDAPRGRLVLRPRLPGSWTRFHVRRLAVGGAAMAMEYDRSGGIHRFVLRQERGAAPLRIILEPELEGRRVVSARVDGQPAELDPCPADGRLRVPVQLVLDHDRRLELEIPAPDA